jgi:hypothetical protein
MSPCVKLIKRSFPRSSDETYRSFWEVCLVTADGEVIQRQHFTDTLMRNYYPLTREEMVEKEARHAATGMAKMLGVELFEPTGS